MKAFQFSLFIAVSFLFLSTEAVMSTGGFLQKKIKVESFEVLPIEPRMLQNAACSGNLCSNNGDDDAYTFDAESKRSYNVVFDISSVKRDLSIEFSSSLQSSSVQAQIFLQVSKNPPKRITTPTGYAWTMSIPQSQIQSYNRLILSAINNADSKTTITFSVYYNYDGSDDDSDDTSVLEIVLPITAAVILMILSILCCYWVRRRQALQALQMQAAIRNYRLHSQNQLANAVQVNNPLTPENLNERFPEANFDTLNSSFPQTTCSICLEELQKETPCRQLYCEHIFHSECVRLWLVNQLSKGHAFCPNCNHNVLQLGQIVRKQAV